MRFRFIFLTLSSRGALGTLRQAEVSQPAPVLVNTGVAHHFSVLALRRSRSVARWRTLGSLRHTEVSEPAPVMSSHVAAWNNRLLTMELRIVSPHLISVAPHCEGGGELQTVGQSEPSARQ